MSAPTPGLLLVLSGPSGVGKTTITRAVRERFPDAVFSVSATTRARSDSETDGVDYFFLGPDDFKRKVTAGEFLEHAVYAGNHYGTLRSQVLDRLAEGRIVILDIDVQGAIQVREKMPDAFAVFLLPPNEDALLERLRARKREPEDAIQRRFEAARKEIELARSRPGLYDVFVTNDDLQMAVSQVVGLVEERRVRRS